MDIGVWMSREILEEKLALRKDRNPEATWNMRRWPKGFVEGEQNRLFVASQGAWRGYFVLAYHAMVNELDPDVPYALLFDTRTWTPILSTTAKRFRGFTYKVPQVGLVHGPSSSSQSKTHPA